MIEDAIRKQYPEMSRTRQRLARFILEHFGEVCFYSLRELSKASQTSEVTILSFGKSLGFPSYIALRNEIRKQAEHKRALCKKMDQLSVLSERAESAELKRFYSFMMTQHSNYLNSIFENSSDLFFTCGERILNAKQIYILGHDASIIPADYLAHRLQFMKINASSHQIGESNSINALMTKLDSHDVLVFISLKDYHKPSQEIARFAQSRGAQIIVITDSMESPVVTEDSLNLLCQAEAPLMFNTMSTPMAIIEILTAGIAILLGDKLDEFMKEFLRVHQYLYEHWEKEKS